MIKILKVTAYTLAATAVAVMVPELAHATGIGSGVNAAAGSIKNVPTLISYASYLTGSALGIAGVVKLKAHVDNPAQNSIKDGLGRLAAGGLLVALPVLLQQLTQSSGTADGSNVSYNAISSLT